MDSPAISILNPVYADTDNGTIDATVMFPDGSFHNLRLVSGCTEPVEWSALTSGVYGAVAPYVAPYVAPVDSAPYVPPYTAYARPQNVQHVGFCTFDRNLGKPIWCKALNPIIWVDATGQDV